MSLYFKSHVPKVSLNVLHNPILFEIYKFYKFVHHEKFVLQRKQILTVQLLSLTNCSKSEGTKVVAAVCKRKVPSHHCIENFLENQ